MNLKEKMIGVMARPEETIKEISEKPYIEEAVLIVGITAIISGISAYMMQSKIIYDFGDIEPGAMEFVNTIVPAFTMISALFGVIIVWIIAAGVVHVVSMALGGEGKFTQMLVVYGYAYIPILISVVVGMIGLAFIEPITISASPTGGPTDVMGGLTSDPFYQVSLVLGYVLRFWSLGLVFLGVKSIHGFNTNRALIAISIPLLFMLLGMIMTLFSNLILGQFNM